MQTIGRYQLLEKLGQGGMGVVYRARDTLLERIVAIKVISAPIDQNSELRERFFREARAAGKLSHKNIITIHDLGEHDGQPYLAMEYLEGQDLLARMAAPQRISLRRKVEIATEMCEGLDYAHAHGVVHRDIKPANIFITDGGTVKILDFGLARLVTSELTRSNMMMGTINYMAPEQIRGDKVDHRVDIFSTAVVLYELLSGRRAFEAESFAATLYKILQEVPEPLQLIDPSIPVELIHIVECGLAKPRDERYQHMSEMLVDLAVYRQRMHALDSPGSGQTSPVEVRSPSGRLMPLSDGAAPTIAGPHTPVSTPLPPTSGAASTPPMNGSRTVAVFAVALLALSIAGVAMWKATRPRPAPTETTTAAPAPSAPTVPELMKSAMTAFEREDFARTIEYTDTVLARDAGNAEARQLRDRASAASAAVERGLQNARSLIGQGRFEEASRAAGEVLSVAPGNREARRIMEDGAARSRGQGAEEARAQVGRARAAARAVDAQRLASGQYGAAGAAEREAQRLYAAGRPGDATVKFYEASGLYRSAEVAAQNETASRQASAREAARGATAKPADPDSARSPAPSSPPPVPASPPERVEQSQLPAPAPPQPAPAPPVNPPASPSSASAPSGSAPPQPDTSAATRDAAARDAAARDAAAREAAVADVLTRYVAAVESRNLEALRRVWPGLNVAALRDEFRNASSIQVEAVEPHITVAGDTATITFIRKYDLVTVERQPLHSESHATMELRRAGASWVIDRIRFVPIR
jgi:eukaryotic-like serine/threonine-protein kinase